MEAFLFSTGFVALAEIGDKTQLLALLLAARFKRPTPIIAGIFVATVLNHALAGSLGSWLTALVPADIMRWVLGGSFLAMAVWLLIPDSIDDEDTRLQDKLGVFAATTIAFFLAEMGDKTQIATVALAARFDSLVGVVMGTTVGMMLANAPVVWLGERITRRVPIRAVHLVSAVIFLGLGVLALWAPN